MVAPHPQHGCPGSWFVTVSSDNYPNYEYGPYSGYQCDEPYIQNIGRTYNGSPAVSLLSVCRPEHNLSGYDTFINVSSNPVFVSRRFVVDPNCEEAEEGYDCLNGSCISKSQYNTPGQYPTLEDCELVCGGDGCNGKCISNSEWVQIENLANQVKNNVCK